MRMPKAIALLLLASPALGQQLLWRIPGVNYVGIQWCETFGDYDGDGGSDIFAIRDLAASSTRQNLDYLILSGRDGRVLHVSSQSWGNQYPHAAGDFDGDGFDEFLWTGSAGRIHVYSPRWSTELFNFIPAVIPGGAPTQYGNGEAFEAKIDLDGDGLNDLLAATTTSTNSYVYAYNHLGQMRYAIPAHVNRWIVMSIANVGDRDGDGGEDFLVGANGGANAEGGVFLFSGRTGTLLRYHPGLQAYDLLGGLVGPAGDFDQDGLPDLVASNPLGFNGHVTVVWSGATGSVLRVWRDPSYQTGLLSSAEFDADLDGLPDVMLKCASCQFVPFLHGAVQVASGRDGAILQETHETSYISGYYGDYVASLGPQPGSPHPVYALTHYDYPQNAGTLEVYRSEPLRTSVTGAGCATTGNVLIPGFRSSPTGSRLQIANAPAGALAWCILGFGASTSTGGLPLPVALDPYGFPGCSLLVPLDFVGTTLTGASGMDRGYAAFDLPVPPAAAAGTRFATQWLVLDPTTGFEAWSSRRDFWLQ
ncbi:MAG: VCBS repeat-containing protein [Rhodoglobus sp.]